MEHLVPLATCGAVLAREGHGVLPSSLRPGLNLFQFGDLVLGKVSSMYGGGGETSRVISQFTAKS